MFKRIFTILTLLLLSASNASAIDYVTTVTGSISGGSTIHFFDPLSGAHLGAAAIPASFDNGAFMAGDWLGTGEPSVLSLSAGGSGTLGTVIGAVTGPFATYDLGAGITRLVTIDYDQSGMTDLAIQYKGKATVTVALNLGSPATSATSFGIRPKSDVTGLFGLSAPTLGSVVFLKPFIPGDPTSNKGMNFIEYLDDAGAKKKIALPKKIETVLPVFVEPTNVYFLGFKSKSLPLFGTAGKIANIPKTKNDYVVVGNFDSDNNSSVLIGKTDGSARIVDLSTRAQRGISFVVPTVTTVPLPPTDPICVQAQEILAALEVATNPAVISSLLQQLADLDPPAECFPDEEDDDSSGGAASALAYIGTLAANGSAAEDARGPCDQFLDPNDGNQGFLAKNSDFHPGSVYLAPGFGYRDARILNPKTFKTIEKLTYSGIGNGGRAHFRTPRPFPKPVHIFAAEYFSGQIHCWRLPSGPTRID